MSLTMPTLPAKTAFRLDQDEFQQPRLRWGGPSLKRRCIQLFAVYSVFAIVCVAPVIPIYLHLNALSWIWLGGWSCMSIVWFVVGMVVIKFVEQSIDPGQESSILLTEAWLLHRPGGHDHEPRGREPRQFDRWQLKAVRLEQGVGRQRLLLDDGAHQDEIGQSLSAPDRTWLAEVIRDWIPPPRITHLV